MRAWRSNVRLFGATYSAAAVSRALEMNPEMNGKFMTFGSVLLRGVAEIVMRGRPIKETKVVLTLNAGVSVDDAYTRITLELTRADPG